jgi:thiol-disulfide isomerase/thioredoxin
MLDSAVLPGLLRSALAVALLAAGPAEALAGGGVADLRAELATLPPDRELPFPRAEELGRRALASAERAARDAERYSALAIVAEVCRRSSPAQARGLRKAALDLLAAAFADSHRWSILLTEALVPPFERLPRAAWAEELAAYDAALSTLEREARDPRLRAELSQARLQVRLSIDRRWDWLTAAQRSDAIALAGSLESCCGTLLVPGERSGGATVGSRARQAREELAALAFRALAPPTAGEDLEGRRLDVSRLRGKVVVLDFWTTFCLPCLAMVPSTRALLDRLQDRPVVLLGVNGDTRREQGLGTARRLGMSWPSFWDGPQGTDGPLNRQWRVTTWPTVVVLDEQGRIRYKFLGREAAEAGLPAAVDALLVEMDAPSGSG